MFENFTSYSPDIQIFLEIEDRKIRLCDLLFETAILFEKTDIPPKTIASLVLSIDGVDEREEIFIEEGVTSQDTTIKFKYRNPNRLNGRSSLNASAEM